MASIVLKKEYPNGYPNDAVKVLKAMSFTDGKKVNVVGSMSLRSQVYAGDYDADEKIVTNSSKTLALKHLTSKFQSILRNLQKLPLTYIGDIKSGSVEEWRLVFKPYNADKSHKRLEELFEKKIISKKEYDHGRVRFIENPNRLEILLLEQDFRPNIIRWKVAEVLKGQKKLQDGRMFTLEEAFSTPTITKLDVVSWVQNNRFTDFSMIYEFKNNGVILNPSIRDFEESILENIYILHHEKKFYKMAKRIFSLAKYHNNTELLELLTPLFNGDLGRLYIVYGDIGTIENLFEIENSLPYKELEIEFDQFKGRLSNIRLSKYIRSEDSIFQDIDVLVNIRKVLTNKPRILKLLSNIKNRLLEILSHYSEEYLRKHKVFVV
jgi:hypothetical protein